MWIGIVVAVVVLFAGWRAGSFDRVLVNVGLNAKECARNGFGATFCGHELTEYRQHQRQASEEVSKAKREREEAANKTREELKADQQKREEDSAPLHQIEEQGARIRRLAEEGASLFE